MARCTNCGTFAALDEPTIDDNQEPEVEISGSDADVTVRVRAVRLSSCCGEEHKAYDFELNGEADHACDEVTEFEENGEADVELSMEYGSRYKAGTITCSASVPIKCSRCGFEEVLELSDTAKAGWFEDTYS